MPSLPVLLTAPDVWPTVPAAIRTQLPDGTQHTHTFKMGATVAYVKLQVEQAYNIPMSKQKLTTSAGRTLIDPLSLADCPGITPETASLVIVSEEGCH